MIFIDTNYFARLLLNDNREQFALAKKLFEDGANKKIDLFSSTIVFFEIYWLFKSFYKKTDNELFVILSGIMRMTFIYFEERNILSETLKIFKKENLGLEDSYNLAYYKAGMGSDFKTFDKNLLKKLHKRQ